MYSTGNYVWSLMMEADNVRKEKAYMYVQLGHHAVQKGKNTLGNNKKNKNKSTKKNGLKTRSSHCGSAETNLTSIHETQVQSLASISGLRIWHCHELWCRSQTQLRSHVAMAVV